MKKFIKFVAATIFLGAFSLSFAADNKAPVITIFNGMGEEATFYFTTKTTVGGFTSYIKIDSNSRKKTEWDTSFLEFEGGAIGISSATSDPSCQFGKDQFVSNKRYFIEVTPKADKTYCTIQSR